MKKEIFSKFLPGTGFLMALLLSLSLTAQAQPGGNPGMDVDELIESLDITADQEEAFREAMGRVRQMDEEAERPRGEGQQGRMRGRDGDQASEQGRAMRDGQQGQRARMRAQQQRGEGADSEEMRQGQQGQRARMEARQQRADRILGEVLDDEQLARFRELRAARMQERRQRDRDEENGDEAPHH